MRIGTKAPGLTLPGVHRDRVREFRLKDFENHWLVLFFYPADFSFICPTEVTGFNRLYPEFQLRVPLPVAFVIGCSFAAGAIVPSIPYLFLTGHASLWAAIGLAGPTLFGIGVGTAWGAAQLVAVRRQVPGDRHGCCWRRLPDRLAARWPLTSPERST